tara:strand:- start:414 stop:593 length:180 start_codon:yes stop_codon:yes gene_type:complete
MSLAINDQALETCQQEVDEEIMMFFALKEFNIPADDFHRYTLQDIADMLTRKKFQDSAR